MGLSIAQYGHAQFNNEIVNFGGGRGNGRARQAETPAPPTERRSQGLEKKRVESPAERAPERLKATSKSSTTTSELQFQVKTAEGDTVTLSVNAVQQSTYDKVSYKSADGSLKVAQKAESSTLQANLAVEGDLSEAELADISKALESLSQGKDVEDLGSLESASFQYNSRTIYTQSRLSLVA